MIKTGFFNSINSDRGYNADDISDYFKGLITDGVFKNYLEDLSLSEELINDGILVLKPGKCIVFGKYILNTNDIEYTIDTNAESDTRTDAIIAWTNLSTRESGIKYIKNIQASTNSSWLTNTENYKHIKLHEIYVYTDNSFGYESNIANNYIRLTNITPTFKRKVISFVLSDFTATTTYTGFPGMYVDIPTNMYEPQENDVVSIYINGIKLQDYNVASFTEPGYYIENINSTTNRLVIQAAVDNTFDLALNHGDQDQSVNIIIQYNEL